MRVFANERDYYSYYVNSFATAEPACVDKKDGPLSGAFAWGCQVQKNLADATDSTVKTFTPAIPGSSLDSSRKSGGTIYKAGSDTSPKVGSGPGGTGTPASKKCSGCNTGDIGCEIGKLSCEFTGALGDAVNSTGNFVGSGVDVLGRYWPFIVAGGVAVIAILLIKK
jgi:hypothetical protein